MKLLIFLVNFILVLVLGEDVSEDGSGLIDLTEGSGSSEVIINLADFEINESAIKGRSDFEDIPKAEKFIGPKYTISRPHENSEIVISDFLPNIMIFPEDKSESPLCSCQCANQYQYEHYQHESESNVEIVLQDGVLGEICKEDLASICCEPTLISTTGQPRFRFPDSNPPDHDLEISESVLMNKVPIFDPEGTITSKPATSHVQNIHSKIDLNRTVIELSKTISSMTNWLIKINVYEESRIELKLSSRGSIGFLAKISSVPKMLNFDILDQLNGSTMEPIALDIKPGTWYFKFFNEEDYDQESLLTISRLEKVNSNLAEHECQLLYGSWLCKNEQKSNCMNGQQSMNKGCECDQEWMGAKCDVTMEECSINYCNQHGNCSIKSDMYGYTNVVCVCEEGFSGKNCEEINCTHDCGVNGVCKDGQCRCFEGWSGENCNKTSPLLIESFVMENLIAEQGRYLKQI